MKLSLSLLSVYLFICNCLAWKHSSERDFRRAISGHNHALVASSQALETEWMYIADLHKSLMSIDCSTETTVCDEFGVISYPALRYFDGHGHTTPYRGPRTASAITSFLRRATRPTITILNEEKITPFQSVDETVLIAHLNPQDEQIRTAYETIATQFRDRASFGLIETAGATTIVCYNNKDEQKFTLSDFTPIDALPNLVQSCSESLIGEFTRANEMKYLQSGKSLVFYFTTTSIDREAFVDKIRPVAKIYKDYLSFVTVDADEYADLATPLGLTHGVFPALAVQNPMYGQVFPYGQGLEISPETVNAFVMDIVQGKVQPWDGQSTGENSRAHDEL
ncbi:thioredoxin-like domain-containing protein [Xylariaceae sp. FL1651]|nr:thioredoxin-like domain-containing protein [Xylariaceae sp. FL1651]